MRALAVLVWWGPRAVQDVTHHRLAALCVLHGQGLAHDGAFAAIGHEAGVDAGRGVGGGERAQLAGSGLAKERAYSLRLTNGLHDD